MTINERAVAYIAKMDPSVSGSRGHDAAFSVACVLVKGFNLSEGESLGIMREHFNPRCAPAWSEADLAHKVRSAAMSSGAVGELLKGGSGVSSGGGDKADNFRVYSETLVAKKAVAARRSEMSVNEAERQKLLRQHGISGVVELMERSPVDVRGVLDAAAFLGLVYGEGERVLIFTDFRSQGDFGFFSAGAGGGKVYRLGARSSVAAERAELPTASREGVWFLCAPVDGQWVRSGAKNKDGSPKLSRRSSHNVTSWRFMLLEADDVEPDEWLAVVSQLPLAVTAIYTSGGRSLHVLVRVDAVSREDFHRIAKKVEPIVAALGGDAAAISGVRLSRLPLCFREGSVGKDGKYVRYEKPRLQRLLYLNPQPEVRPLCGMKRVRVIELKKEAAGE